MNNTCTYTVYEFRERRKEGRKGVEGRKGMEGRKGVEGVEGRKGMEGRKSGWKGGNGMEVRGWEGTNEGRRRQGGRKRKEKMIGKEGRGKKEKEVREREREEEGREESHKSNHPSVYPSVPCTIRVKFFQVFVVNLLSCFIHSLVTVFGNL